jgi:predicted DNA-binding transcriptional regulator AlpA
MECCVTSTKPIPEEHHTSVPEELLPPLCRIQHVLTVVPIARSTIWLWARQGRFPAPKKYGAITVWKRDEILSWLAKASA